MLVSWFVVFATKLLREYQEDGREGCVGFWALLADQVGVPELENVPPMINPVSVSIFEWYVPL